MKSIRTPESRFENLKDYPFEPHYTEVDAGDGSALRMHYLDEGEGEIILCLHGQPSWSYLYRKMIPLLTKAGYRVIAPDLVGFGKSDKPIDRTDYTYANHVFWMKGFVEALDLSGVTLVCQDWGSLIGLRVVAENQARFARVVLANGGLPDGTGIPVEMTDKLNELLRDTPVLPAEEMFEKIAGPMEDRPQFMYWVRHSDAHPDFHPGVHMKLVLGSATTRNTVPGLRHFLQKNIWRARGNSPRLFPLSLTMSRYPLIRPHGKCLRSSKSRLLPHLVILTPSRKAARSVGSRPCQVPKGRCTPLSKVPVITFRMMRRKSLQPWLFSLCGQIQRVDLC